MKRIYLIILAVAFVSLAAIYYWQQRPRNLAPQDLFTKVCQTMDPDDINRIEVWAKGDVNGTRLDLIKKDGNWWVKRGSKQGGFLAPAKADRIKRLLKTLIDLEGETRAKGTDVLGTFNLKDNQGLHILLEGPGIKTVIIAGKKGPRWDTCFVRRGSSDQVILASKNILSLFDIWSELPEKTPSSSAWTDLSIASYGPGEIEGVSFSQGDEQWSLVRKENKETKASRTGENAGKGTNSTATQEKGGNNKDNVKKAPSAPWTFTENGNVREIPGKKAIGYLSKLFPLNAIDVEDPRMAKDYGLGPGQHSGRITVHTKKGVVIFHIGSYDAHRKTGWIQDEKGVIYRIRAEWVKMVLHPFKGEKKEKRKNRPA